MIALVWALVGLSALQPAARLRCEAQQKWLCELPAGCSPANAASTWQIVDFDKRTYARCDRAGCDTYEMVITVSGAFRTLQPVGHPDVFLKIGLANLFVEVATIGVSTYTSLGTCRPEPRPR